MAAITTNVLKNDLAYDNDAQGGQNPREIRLSKLRTTLTLTVTTSGLCIVRFPKGSIGQCYLTLRCTTATGNCNQVNVKFGSIVVDAAGDIQVLTTPAGVAIYTDLVSGGSAIDFTAIAYTRIDVTKWFMDNGDYNIFLSPDGFILYFVDNGGGNIAGVFEIEADIL